MRSTFLGLEMSKRTIQLSQKALDITGSNLSNSKVEGYTRQQVDIGSSYLNHTNYWQTTTSKMSLAGQGAIGIGVDQVRDPYIDKRYRESTPFV
ncbi:MAG TPA: flagellar hook-associated protein FlgK, partial [Ruminococcaceae bacterium]|nr:flagellar hook-associated protein FlgK [Oscillospiraceae bacterium]